MRKYMVLLLPVIALLSNTVLAAEKTVADPRLAEKITIDCVSTRLYKTLDQISAETGVITRTGRLQSDWKVRDVPVLVCARDIQLGVLLRGIADTTHLLFSRYDANDAITYRIWRDKKREDELAAFEEAEKKAAAAAMAYDWETLSLVKDLPEAKLEDRHAAGNIDPESGRLWGAGTRAVSKIVAALGPEVKKNVLAGETVILSTCNAPENVKPLIKSAFEIYWKSTEHSAVKNGQDMPKPLTDERLQSCFVKIHSNRFWSDPGDLIIETWSSGYGYRSFIHEDYELTVRRNWPEYPKRPEVTKPNLKSDDISSRYKLISFEKEGGPDFLDKNVKIAAQEDKKKKTYPDLLCALSRAIGYSIIAEGYAARYTDRNMSKMQELSDFFGKEVTAREVLKFSTELDNISWYIDKENKLIIGRDRKWTERLNALVPEKTLLDMRDKLKKGVGLDDLEPFTGLSEAQCHEWILNCPEFPELNAISGAASMVGKDSDKLWKIYFTLSPSERAQTIAGQSVQLSGFDRTWLSNMLRRSMNSHLHMLFMNSFLIEENPGLVTKAVRLEELCNPSDMPDLWLWIKKFNLPKPYADRYSYVIYLGDQDQGEPIATDSLAGFFPITTPKPNPEPEKQPTKNLIAK